MSTGDTAHPSPEPRPHRVLPQVSIWALSNSRESDPDGHQHAVEDQERRPVGLFRSRRDSGRYSAIGCPRRSLR